MKTSIKKPDVNKRIIRVIAIALLLIIFASSIFMLDSKAYFPPSPKADPPSSVGPNIHYAIGTHRVVCMGCTGQQSNIGLPNENNSSDEK